MRVYQCILMVIHQNAQEMSGLSTQDILNVLNWDRLGLVACAISGPRAQVICSSLFGRNAGF